MAATPRNWSPHCKNWDMSRVRQVYQDGHLQQRYHQYSPRCYQTDGVLSSRIQQVETPPRESADKLDQCQVLLEERISLSGTLDVGNLSGIWYESRRRDNRQHTIHYISRTVCHRTCSNPRQHIQSDRDQRLTAKTSCCLANVSVTERQQCGIGHVLSTCVTTHDAHAAADAVATASAETW